MTAQQSPTANPPEAIEGPDVTVEGGAVVVQAPGAPAFALTPEAATLWAERLLEAADQARAAGSPQARAKPPFPPAELVSPHGAA